MGVGPKAQDVVRPVAELALQIDEAEQFEPAVIAVPRLKPGTRVEIKTVTTRNGRVSQALSFNRVRYREQRKTHIARPDNARSNVAAFTLGQFNSA